MAIFYEIKAVILCGYAELAPILSIRLCRLSGFDAGQPVWLYGCT